MRALMLMLLLTTSCGRRVQETVYIKTDRAPMRIACYWDFDFHCEACDWGYPNGEIVTICED